MTLWLLTMTLWLYDDIYIYGMFFSQKIGYTQTPVFFFSFLRTGLAKTPAAGHNFRVQPPSEDGEASPLQECPFGSCRLLVSAKLSTSEVIDPSRSKLNHYSDPPILLLIHLSTSALIKKCSSQGEKKGSVCCLSASFAVWFLGMLRQLSLSKGTQRLGQILSWFGFEVTMTDS